ncbi:unnamed protein product [Phytophthora fragariaefolia]|uniref:Unnamed protein product n=1 Tax=Phytophthora fragariaefolia TaxID=1490495 RepID=A0A9W6XMK2_9STRA|nr:unnamed protein product [Phytophthora fragariaefolia]
MPRTPSFKLRLISCIKRSQSTHECQTTYPSSPQEGEDVREWQFQVENACRINGFVIQDENSRLPEIAGSVMVKPASGWFLHWASTTRVEELTWGGFREHVIQHFEASNYHASFYVKLKNLETLSEAMDLAVNRTRGKRSEKKVGSSLSRNPSVLTIEPAFTARNLVTSGPSGSQWKKATRESRKRATASVNEGPDVVERVTRTTEIENISLTVLCETPLVYKPRPLFSVIGDMAVGDTSIPTQSIMLVGGATTIYVSRGWV